VAASFVIDHVRGEGRKARSESINQFCEETRSIALVETVKILLTSRAYIHTPRASDCLGGIVDSSWVVMTRAPVANTYVHHGKFSKKQKTVNFTVLAQCVAKSCLNIPKLPTNR